MPQTHGGDTFVAVGSKTFDGVRFAAFSHDHPPPHVHGYYAGIVVVVQLLIVERGVALAARKDRVLPRNAKRSDVNHVLEVAQQNFAEVVRLWEEARP